MRRTSLAGISDATIRRAGGKLMAFAILVVAPAGLRADEPEPTADSPAAVEPADFAGDIAAGAASVLIEAREATPADEAATEDFGEGESLEPISQVPEHEPELAGDVLPLESDDLGDLGDEAAGVDDATQFGAALSRAVRKDSQPHRARPLATTTETPRPNSIAAEARTKVAKFNGIQPGTSQGDDVLELWGEPVDKFRIDGGSVLIYETEPFRQIEVVLIDDDVDTIKIELETSVSSERLVEQLRLEEIEPAEIYGEDGQLLGQIFPERGVLFMHAVADGDDPLTTADLPAEVTHIVIQPLDPVAFTLRAENHLHGPYEQNIRDLKLALALDPDQAHAQWLLADIYLATGQAKQAEAAAEAAFQLDPGNDAYRLRWARSLEILARYDEAVHETRAVLDGQQTPQIVKAQALHQMGRLATLGGIEIRDKAIPFANKAIEIADELATSDDPNERRAAKELLVEAHLTIAREIATQKFNNQLESISQWIGRASGLAEDAIENDGGSVELRLRVAEAALACLADLKPTRNPASWIAEARTSADDLIAQYDDTLWQRRIKWQLGVAYFHAIRVEHTRRQTNTALRYGERAIDNLAEGAKSREAVPDSEHLVGRLYFHIGAIHAVHEKDHEGAVTWYDKAMPLLTASVPVTELAVPRRHGEALVSMGVTYWQLGQRLRALELTEQGTDLVEKAVAGGVLDKDALAVPYGNLATMHKELGNPDEGAKYANLAQNARGNRPAIAPDSPATSASRGGRRVAANPGPSGTGMNVHPEQRRNMPAGASQPSQQQRPASGDSGNENAAGNGAQTTPQNMRQANRGNMNRMPRRPRRVSQRYGNGGYSSAPGM